MDEDGNYNQFKWSTRVTLSENGNPTTTDSMWEMNVANEDTRMKDEVSQFSLKLDLMNHIWDKYGQDT